LKIAYLNTNYSKTTGSGGATHIHEFIEEVVKKGHVIYSGNYNKHPKVRQLPKNKILQLLTLLNCDVIYIRYEGKLTKNMQFSKYPLRIIAKRSLVVWEFNTVPEYNLTKGGNIKDVEKQKQLLQDEAKICDLAICVTDEMADYYKKETHFLNTIAVSNGSNPEHFKPDFACPKRMEYFSGKINVVWAGSLHLLWNDTDLLIRTAIMLWEMNKRNICFHMIGNFPAELVNKIPPNVFLYGKQPYEAIPNWLAAMDIGLILYKERQNEYGSPIKLFDYLSSGLSVISTPHPQTGRIFAEIGQEKFMLKTEDANELSSLILDLADHPEKMLDFKFKGREIIQKKYNWENSVNQILNEVNSLLNKKRKVD
jgi:glycosyltransferase involved in cell wall biosynthesis